MIRGTFCGSLTTEAASASAAASTLAAPDRMPAVRPLGIGRCCCRSADFDPGVDRAVAASFGIEQSFGFGLGFLEFRLFGFFLLFRNRASFFASSGFGLPPSMTNGSLCFWQRLDWLCRGCDFLRRWLAIIHGVPRFFFQFLFFESFVLFELFHVGARVRPLPLRSLPRPSCPEASAAEV